MSKRKCHNPHLATLFRRYLTTEDTAQFIASVSRRYTVATLQRLAERGSRNSRRAATLALSLMAGYESNAVLGRALHDPDRGVRLIAEKGIQEVWCLDGNDPQRQQLRIIIRLNYSGRFEEAIDRATWLIDEAPSFAEAWNQRAIALFSQGRYDESANDCQQTLELNPYHFAAAVGMAKCYLETNDAFAALQCFRRALKLNPNLEGVRARIAHLQRALEGN